MKIKIKEQKKRGTEFFNGKTGSDKETWDDINSEEDDKWAKLVSLQSYIKKDEKDNKS